MITPNISPPLHQYLLLKQGTSCMITPHISPPQHQYLPCLSLSESIRTYQRNSDTLRLIPIGSDKLRYPPNNIPPAPYRTICSLERTSVHASAHLCPQTHARAAPRLRTCLRTPPHQHAHRSSLSSTNPRTSRLTPAHVRALFYQGRGAVVPYEQIVPPMQSNRCSHAVRGDVRRYLGKVYRVFPESL